MDGIESDLLDLNNNDQKHDDNDSSSSDSGVGEYLHLTNKNRLFGRQKPIHVVLGGGKSADIILWRNKRVSASIFAGATVIWLLFEWIGYHLLTFVCHSLVLILAMFFLSSNLAAFANMSPPEFPDIVLPENLFVNVALLLRDEFNRASNIFRDVALGKDLKQFLLVIFTLWVISVVGSWFNFLTLIYLVFVMLHTLPVLYEKNEDSVDTYAEQALVEIKKQYAVLDEKVLQKLPKVPFHMDNKQH